MSENICVKEMKEFLNAKDKNTFLIKLCAIYICVALGVTVFAVVTGMIRRWMIGILILWGMGIAACVMSAMEMNKDDGLKKIAQNGSLEEAAADFSKGLKLHNDMLRMGETYVFARKGGVAPYAKIRKGGLRVLPLQEARFIQYYIQNDEGRQMVIYQETEDKVNKRDIEAIVFHLAAKAKNISFN